MTMPVLFVGHGSPMNAIEDNEWTRAWKSLGSRMSKPRAILAVSAHWWTRGVFATAQEAPETIHDFSGFAPELMDVVYPAPGSPLLAQRISQLVPGARAVEEWGLDHGTWSVLVHLFPNAEIPVVQISMDAGMAPQDFLALGRKLAPLREEGVLIVASGNVTHNLPDMFARYRSQRHETPDWAHRFDAATAKALLDRDETTLLELDRTPDGRLSHPTADHWFPLLVAYGASSGKDSLRWSTEGWAMGSGSMRVAEWVSVPIP